MSNINTNKILNIKNITLSIESATTRDEVRKLLNNLKRKELLEIASHFKVYVRSFDSREMIIIRIVEMTVGFKLTHESISNINLHY